MRKVRIIWLLALLLVVGCRHVPEDVLPIGVCAMPPEGRACATCFALNDTVYIIGGRVENGKYSNTMMLYIPSNDQWISNISTPLQARVHGVACDNATAAYVGLGYAGGGIYGDNTYLRDWWRFEPKGRIWKRLADFPSDKTVSAVAFADEDYVWVGFGFNGFGNELWRYSIVDDAWESIPCHKTWPARLMAPVAAKVDGRFFQGTGFLTRSRTDWWEFFPEDQHWERRSPLPGAGRHNAACAATERAAWVLGGWHYGDSLTDGYHFADILRYTPSDDQWTICGAIPCGVTENGVAAGVGNRLYFGLGENDKSILHQKWYCLEE